MLHSVVASAKGALLLLLRPPVRCPLPTRLAVQATRLLAAASIDREEMPPP